MDEERSYLGARLITVGVFGAGIYLLLGLLAKFDKISPPGFRLLETTWVTIVGLLLVWVFMREPKSDRPVTWAASMAGAVGIFAIILLAYGSVPHEWLTYADSTLNWRADAMFVRHGQWTFFTLGNHAVKWPLDVTKQAVRDIIAVLIYVVFFGLQLFMWVKWQAMKKAAPVRTRPAAVPTPAGTSAFGRPVVKQS